MTRGKAYTLAPMFKPHYKICFVGFLLDFAVMVGITAIPFFLYQRLGGGAAMSGAFGAAHSAAYAVCCIVSAGMVTRARNGLNWAFLGVAVYTIGIGLMPFFNTPIPCLVVSSVAHGGLALAWPALHSWVGSDPDPVQRTRHMAWFNLSWSFGFAVSPFFAGPLFDADFRWPFVILVLLCLVCLALIKSLPHEKSYFGTASAEQLAARADHDRASEAYLYCGWCATFIANMLIAVTRSVYPKRVEELVSTGMLRLLFETDSIPFLAYGPATKFSFIAGAMSFATGAAFVVLGRTHAWRHRFQVLFWSQVLSAGAFWVLGSTRSLAVMGLCFIVVGANLGVAFFSSAYYSLADPAHKHRRLTINEGAVGVGGFVGSSIFGYLVGRYGIAMPFHYTPLLIIGGLMLQWGLLEYGKHRAALAIAPPTRPSPETP